MPQDLCVFIVHGVGTQEAGFSKPLRENIAENFRKALKYMGQPHPSPDLPLNFGEGLWSDLTQKGEDELNKLFKKSEANLDWMKLRKFLIDYGGDVVSYFNFKGGSNVPLSRYDAIHEKIHQQLINLSAKSPPLAQQKPLTVVAHSLGSVVMSDYFYDLQTLRRNSIAEHNFSFANFFTLGSPIAIYANRFYNDAPPPGAGPFDKFTPHQVEDQNGMWINIFDEDDIIGYPIRPVNAHCQSAVAADLNVSTGSFLTGWTPLSHMSYFDDEEVGKIIAEKLAIDWLRINGSDNAGQTALRIADYKERYRIP